MKRKHYELVRKLASKRFADRFAQDNTCQFSADEWVYLLQGCNTTLLAVVVGLATNAIYDKIKSVLEEGRKVRLKDVYARRVINGVAKYEMAIKRLETGCRGNKRVELIVATHKDVLKMIHPKSRLHKSLLGILKEVKHIDDTNIESVPVDMVGIRGLCRRA